MDTYRHEDDIIVPPERCLLDRSGHSWWGKVCQLVGHQWYHAAHMTRCSGGIVVDFVPNFSLAHAGDVWVCERCHERRMNYARLGECLHRKCEAFEFVDLMIELEKKQGGFVLANGSIRWGTNFNLMREFLPPGDVENRSKNHHYLKLVAELKALMRGDG